MFKKSISIFVLAFFAVINVAIANEGMWLLMHINGKLYKKMKETGLKLSPEEIYSVNQSSLKDAIVSFGGFCTGEIISKEGLVLTNHHCGYDGIQQSSTVENNYLRDGFWAQNNKEEIPIPGLYVKILNYMEDITEQALEGVNDDMSESERINLVTNNIETIKRNKLAENDKLIIETAEMFDGNEYYLFAFNKYEDIRLVGTPPEAIGKFGGDTDNWMWPRHTGDFSLFRIYADAEGKPSAYNENNVPYKPAHHLPINIKGVKEGDYAMILGFPGSTDRFMTSNEVEFAVTKEQPQRVEIRRKKLDLMDAGMDKSEEVRLKYSSKHANVANYWKYYIGQSEQLINNNVPAKKLDEEKALTEWINKDPNRLAEYGDLIKNLETAQNAGFEMQLFRAYFIEAIYGSELNTLIFRNAPTLKAIAEGKVPEEKIAAVKVQLRAIGEEFFKNYDYEVSKNIYGAMLDIYTKKMPQKYWGNTITEINKKYKGNFSKFADSYFSKSVFSTQEKFNNLIEKPNVKAIDKEYGANIWNELYLFYRGNGETEGAEIELARQRRLFTKALREFNSDKIYYPNANSTIRLTYGNVLPYSPKDAVNYSFETTAQGILQKDAKTEDKTDEFYVWDKLKELIKNKDYGQYANKDGELIVCFLANTDITGGNSGSPVINANGHLIGTAFDGNWEAMSGDIAFEEDLQRTINLDVRYTLFIIEKFGEAKHLIDEMTIIK